MSTFFPVLRSSVLFPDDRLLDHLYDRLNSNLSNNFTNVAKNLPLAMAIDLKDEGDHYLLEADLPGYSKESIKLNYKNQILTLQASRTQVQVTDQEAKTSDEEVKPYVLKERTTASVRRELMIRDIVEADIQATLDQGVLKVILPKKNTANSIAGRDITIS